MKKDIIKYLACAAMALGLATTAHAALVAGDSIQFGSVDVNTPAGGNMLLAPSMSFNGAPNIGGSGTLSGVASVFLYQSVYSVFPPVPQYPTTSAGTPFGLTPAYQANRWFAFTAGGLTYEFDVTSEFQYYTSVSGSTTLSMVGDGLFIDQNNVQYIGNYQLNWGQSGQGAYSLQGNASVGARVVTTPDGGLTIMLLGGALSGLALIRRKLA